MFTEPAMMLFAGNANPSLARAVAAHLQVRLGKATVGCFSDGEVMVEIERRRDTWTELSYDGVEERFTDDLIVQTFTVSGVDATGRRFSSDAVDLYPLRDGRITRKQTYWKQFS